MYTILCDSTFKINFMQVVVKENGKENHPRYSNYSFPPLYQASFLDWPL